MFAGEASELLNCAFALCMAAFAAARETDDPAAAAAALRRSGGIQCVHASPADVQQTKHVVGPAAYAPLALSFSTVAIQPSPKARSVGQSNTFPTAATPAADACFREAGNSRLEMILYQLDDGIRNSARC